MRDLTDVLEDVKQMGNYAVMLYYGENVGADDSDVPPGERRTLIVSYPVGYLGGLKFAVAGKRDEVITMNIKDAVPQVLPNPPGDSLQREHTGVFIWGPEDNVQRYLNRLGGE